MKKTALVILFLFTGIINIYAVTSQSENLVQTETPKSEKISSANIAFVKSLQQKLSENDLDGAIALFNNLPLSLASDCDLQVLHASLCYSARRFDEAYKIALELNGKFPDNIEVLEILSLVTKANGNRKANKDYNAKILAIDPNNVTVNIQIAQGHAADKHWKLAYKAYQKALVKEPENEEALFGYAKMAFYLDDLKRAESTFNKIIRLNPYYDEAYCYLGKLAADGSNYQKALEYVNKAIELKVDCYDYYVDQGSYYYYSGKTPEAINAWNRAVEINPDYFLAYTYLAGLYDEKNDFEKALYYYNKIMETNPNYYYAYEETGILYWHEQNWNLARKYFIKAYETSGKKEWTYVLMAASTYMKQGDFQKSKNLLMEAMKTTKRDTLEFDMLKYYYDTPNKNGALLLNQKIAKEESSTKRGKLLFYMGLFSEIYGQSEQAADYYTKVTEMQAPMFFEYRLAEWGLGK